ncbi:Chalcone synthase [Zostera marina]|uniref:chalcone synthase n=1 Tax=Zostera marina TaxID=29655 RepID=A0A0K9NV10_ZOSMR|nr:Chalcone synthase [Zostera marina]
MAFKTIESIRKAQRAEGPATVLAMGTANPPQVLEQASYTDWHFRVTKSEHQVDLKKKIQRVCDNSGIKTRSVFLTEEIIEENPILREFDGNSVNIRQELAVVEVPKLGEKAARKAIKEWGQPMEKITHLIFCSMGGVDMPGADYKLVKLLGLNPSVKRIMMYQVGCFVGVTAMRLAKDITENNRGARVLVVTCDIMSIVRLRGPKDGEMSDLLSHTLFGDGAAALIIGSEPINGVEKPLFEIVSAYQTLIPETEEAIDGHLKSSGLSAFFSRDIPKFVSENIETCLTEAFGPIGVTDWNSIFWVSHVGSKALLDHVEAKLNLTKDKLRAPRKVLSEYGNMSSSSALFCLNEMRNHSTQMGKSTTGEGSEWGVVFGFGPGMTVDTLVLHSIPTPLDG